MGYLIAGIIGFGLGAVLAYVFVLFENCKKI